MARTIQFLILANSIRQRDRCIAGKELEEREKGRCEGVRWLRLADPSTEDGAVPAIRTRMQKGDWASVLDVVELQVNDFCGDENHPEDVWLVNSVVWKPVGKYSVKELKWFVDKPETLWSIPGSAKSVELGYVPTMKPPASLYLIQLERESPIDYWKEKGTDGREKTQMRMRLTYRGRSHELAVTDPVFTARYEIYQQAEMNRTKTLYVQGGTYVCVSLTREWKGRQYKIAATILEPDYA